MHLLLKVEQEGDTVSLIGLSLGMGFWVAFIFINNFGIPSLVLGDMLASPVRLVKRALAVVRRIQSLWSTRCGW